MRDDSCDRNEIYVDIDCDNENCESDVQMSCAAYLCRVSQMCVDANSSVCGCNDVHTWIEEAVGECDDAFDCVVELDQCAHGIVACAHGPPQITHSIHTPSSETFNAYESKKLFALSSRTFNFYFESKIHSTTYNSSFTHISDRMSLE